MVPLLFKASMRLLLRCSIPLLKNPFVEIVPLLFKVVMPLLFLRAGLKNEKYTIEPVLDIEKLESHEDGSWGVVIAVVIAVSPLCPHALPWVREKIIPNATAKPRVR
jgi:hypothetical protein